MDYRNRHGLGLVVAVAIGACAVPAMAAPAGYVPSGPGSLAGFWTNTAVSTLQAGPRRGGAPTFRTSGGVAIPLLPSVAKVVADRRAGRDDGKPFPDPDRPACLTQGMPTIASPPVRYPLEILETPEQISVLLQYFRNFRAIRMNTDHPEDPDPTYMGNSVGRWDKGALVVDTTAVNDKTNILGVIPHSDQLHVVERIRRTGPATMEDRITIEDPKTFSKPWTTVSRFKMAAIVNLDEFPCGKAVAGG